MPETASEVPTMTAEAVWKWILNSKGRFFSIHFVTRGTGELREMECSYGVKVHSNGGELRYNAADHYLVTVADTQLLRKKKRDPKINPYRNIAIEGIQKIMIEGVWHNVTHPKLEGS